MLDSLNFLTSPMLNRRNFLSTCISSSGILLPAAFFEHNDFSIPSFKMNSSIGILRMELVCNDIDKQFQFYNDILELKTERISEEKIIVHAGSTMITFYSNKFYKDPIYHFAFNIPENKLEESLGWLKRKNIEIAKRADGSEIYNFSNWNAHAAYFLDPAGNILEFIARHDLPNKSDRAFSSKDILYASEIGLVVDNVEKQVRIITKASGLEVYKVNTANFAAVGNEHNLLIVVPKGRAWLGSTANIPAAAFPVNAILGSSVRKSKLVFEDLPFTIIT